MNIVQSFEATALDRVAEQLRTAQRPIVACSFGKDSLVVLHLALRIRKVPVLFFRHAKFQDQYAHAYSVAQAWDLEMYDLMPSSVIDYQQGDWYDMLELYRCGPQHNLVMVDGIRPYRPEDGSRYFCAVDDFLLRPKALATEYKWDVTLLGSKETDPLHLADRSGPMQPERQNGWTKLAFPIHDWSDDDVWSYIARYDLPVDYRRYRDKEERVNPDRMATCYHCRDTTLIGQQVYCPKAHGMIDNIARTPEEHANTKTAIMEAVQYCQPVGDGQHAPTR